MYPVFFGCPEAITLLGQPCSGWTVRKAVGNFWGNWSVRGSNLPRLAQRSKQVVFHLCCSLFHDLDLANGIGKGMINQLVANPSPPQNQHLDTLITSYIPTSKNIFDNFRARNQEMSEFYKVHERGTTDF